MDDDEKVQMWDELYETLQSDSGVAEVLEVLEDFYDGSNDDDLMDVLGDFIEFFDLEDTPIGYAFGASA